MDIETEFENAIDRSKQAFTEIKQFLEEECSYNDIVAAAMLNIVSEQMKFSNLKNTYRSYGK